MMKIAVPLMILVICVLSFPVSAQQRLSEKVIGISDGEAVTFVTTDQQKLKIRLAEIDAQEREQPYGQSCAGKKTCSQMKNCTEARFYLTQCGLSRLDRDKDGIPCESICK